MLKISLRSISSHKLRLALTTLAVVLGVAFASGMLMLTHALNATFIDIFEGSAQDAPGSDSTRSARISRLKGTARIAASGPRTHVQKISDKKVSVGESPTVSPTIRGWMIDWITKLMTQ